MHVHNLIAVNFDQKMWPLPPELGYRVGYDSTVSFSIFVINKQGVIIKPFNPSFHILGVVVEWNTNVIYFLI